MPSPKTFEMPAGFATMGPGYLSFKLGWPEEFKPVAATFQYGGRDTGLIMPDIDASGAREKEDILKATVIKCGLAANRNSIEPFGEEIQKKMGFPLPMGTTLILRNVTRWKIGPNEYGLQTFDYVRAFPPGVNPYEVMARESEELKQVLAKAIKENGR